jgi:hypothetical protein
MLQVGLSAWIIQDGNYKEFEVGREYRFALEFYPDEIVVDPDQHSEPRLSLVGNAIHEARGTVLFRSDSAWAVDFGVPAYQEAKPPAWAKIGTSIRGRIYVRVDPFFYFESLKFEDGMPNLFRQWFVRRILLETTPWRTATDAEGRKVLSRDATRESFVDVPATDAWNHDGGHGHYLLECELRGDPTV